MDHEKLKSVLVDSLLKSGELIVNSISHIQKVSYKGDINLLTEIDQQVEKLIVENVLAKFQDHSILAEESTPIQNSAYKWIIDPIDGTTNFVHSFPVCCTSIACEFNGDLIMGGVYDPFRNELFFAEKNKGAYLNDSLIQVSQNQSIDKSLMATGFPYDRKYFIDYYLRYMKAMMIRSHGVRRMGSAAIDLCYVACGRYDGFWEFKLNPWDLAVGVLLVQEAGGKVTDMSGGEFDLYGSEVVASNQLIHQEMIDILHPIYLERPEEFLTYKI